MVRLKHETTSNYFNIAYELVVPINNKRLDCLSGNLLMSIKSAWSILFENLGPMSTYSINLSILSITIQDNDDL